MVNDTRGDDRGGGGLLRFSCTFFSSLQGGTLALFCFLFVYILVCASQPAERIDPPRGLITKGTCAPRQNPLLSVDCVKTCDASLHHPRQRNPSWADKRCRQRGVVGAEEEMQCSLGTEEEYIHNPATGRG